MLGVYFFENQLVMNIKAEDLMIGNWVNGGIDVPVYYQIKPSDFVNTDFSVTKPISITPEILTKHSEFELIGKYYFWNFKHKGNKLVLSMWMEDKPMAGFERKGVCYWGEQYIEIEYVHELQQLFRFLTKKNLNIQL